MAFGILSVEERICSRVARILQDGGEARISVYESITSDPSGDYLHKFDYCINSKSVDHAETPDDNSQPSIEGWVSTLYNFLKNHLVVGVEHVKPEISQNHGDFIVRDREIHFSDAAGIFGMSPVNAQHLLKEHVNEYGYISGYTLRDFANRLNIPLAAQRERYQKLFKQE